MSSNIIVGPNGAAVPTSKAGQLLVDTTSPAVYAGQRGDVHVLPCTADPNAADCDFFYMKNNDLRDLIIFHLRVYIAAGTDTAIAIKTGVTGTPTSGTAITPINLRTGGGTALVSSEFRIADMALTGGTTVETVWVDTSHIGEQAWDFESGIILPHDTALVFNAATDVVGNSLITQTFFYFADPE